MANTIKVEVKAIYELPGVTPPAARITQRDNDLALAVTQSQGRTHYMPGGNPVPPNEEYLTAFGNGAGTPYERYGFGWVGTQWLMVAGDGDAVGNAIFTRLNTRNMKNGSVVQVFPVDRDAGPYVSGPVSFQRSWPPRADDTP